MSQLNSPNSTNQMLEFFHTIEKLKTQKRTGWVHEHIDQPESIADHMYRMSMMAIILDTNPPLDISKCTMMCLVHDLAEADVGDITPLCGVSHEEKVKRESAAMKRICSLLPRGSIAGLRLKSLWDEYEARITPESKIVKDLDLFELALQGVEYERRNDVRTLHPFFASTIPRIQHPTVQQWAHDLMMERKAAWASRGWENYNHVDVSTSASLQRQAKIPIRVYGNHHSGEHSQVAEV